MTHIPPKLLIPKERDYNSWFTAFQAYGSGPCAAMVDYGADAGEKPVVRDIVEEEYI
jgi:hypothetical protein